MTLQSMTGFARSDGFHGRYRWAWELRSVNGKGLDLRLRLPAGMEAIEPELRDIASKSLSRGNIQAGLSLSTSETKLEAVVNREALDAVLALKRDLVGADPVVFAEEFRAKRLSISIACFPCADWWSFVNRKKARMCRRREIAASLKASVSPSAH